MFDSLQVLFWDTRKMGEPVEHMSCVRRPFTARAPTEEMRCGRVRQGPTIPLGPQLIHCPRPDRRDEMCRRVRQRLHHLFSAPQATTVSFERNQRDDTSVDNDRGFDHLFEPAAYSLPAPRLKR